MNDLDDFDEEETNAAAVDGRAAPTNAFCEVSAKRMDAAVVNLAMMMMMDVC